MYITYVKGEDVIVVALGGNALVKEGQRGTFDEQLTNILGIAPALVELAREFRVILTHGNGPQVGALYLQQEYVQDKVPAMPLHACVAMTQSLIGYMIQQAINQVMPSIPVSVITTRVLVDLDDQAFRNPTKPIGPYYSENEAKRMQEKRGWVFRKINRRGYRRVVPSPRPVEIIDMEPIVNALGSGGIVIAGGGGGIPVIKTRDGFRGVDAVIDKDYTSSLLAKKVSAKELIILTDVEGVYLNYGKPQQKLLREITVTEAREYLSKGYFPPGSMGPKVEAAVEFVESTDKLAVIGSLNKILDVVARREGTVIHS